MLLQVEEVDQTSDHHTNHCSTPATKELFISSEMKGSDDLVTDDLRPPATKRLKQEGSYCDIHMCTVYTVAFKDIGSKSEVGRPMGVAVGGE